MKILYNIAGTYRSGGMERVLANKANWLVQNGYEVVIVTTDQRNEQPFFPLDNRIICYDLGIGYEENNGKSFINKLVYYPIKQYKHRKRLEALLHKIKPDITISMMCNDVSILPCIKDGSKKILEIHFSKFKRLQYARRGLWRIADIYRNLQEEKLVRQFDRFVVLTEEDRGYWGDLCNMQVIPNARTYTFEKPATLTNKVVMAVGRYDYQKGFDRLIDAWAIVCSKFVDWKLEIIGDGNLRSDMLKQIESKGLNEQIILKRIPANEMKEAYMNASIFVLSSRYEGLPMVLLEAQAAGLPIVSFACKCGPKDVVKDGIDGYLVEEGDVNALASRLISLMDDEITRKKMGFVAFSRSDRYAEESVMAKWVDLFDKVLKG